MGSDAGLDDLASRLTLSQHNVVQLGETQGLSDLAEILRVHRAASGQGLDAVHLYGHGAAGQLQIGRDRITGAVLERDAQLWRDLGQSLSPGGDLLVYGCDLAASREGVDLIQGIAALTGADVAASDDASGGAGDAADWNLELTIGDVQPPHAGLEALGWQGTLGLLEEPLRLQSVNGLLDVTLRAHRGPQMIEVADPANPLQPGTLKKVNGFMTYAWTLHQGISSTGELRGDNEQGPTLQVQPGDRLRIRLENDLGDQATNLHTHGLLINPSGNSDNVLIAIPPGYANVYEYLIPKDQEPGVNWYHPHKHLDSAEQVYRGLSGFLVVGNGDNDINEIQGYPFRMMMLQAQTIGVGADGEPLLLPFGSVDSSDAITRQSGGHFQMTLNGQYMPDIVFGKDYEAWVQLQTNPRDLVRTFFPEPVSQGGRGRRGRGVNPSSPGATNDVSKWSFGNLNNINTYFVAQDGEAFPSTVGKTRVNLEPGGRDDEALKLLRERSGGFATALAPGKRVTEMVTAPAYASSPAYFAATIIQPGPGSRQHTQPLARLQGYEQGGDQNFWDDKPLSSPTLQYEDLSTVPVDVVREIVFETRPRPGAPGQFDFMINGEVYPNAPVLQPRAGQVEEWRVTNKDNVPHPIHLHMQSFQAEAVNIGRVVDGVSYTIPPHYYDSDVWYMDPNAVNVFRIRWNATLGESVYHCHNLIHEDGGMMAALNIIPEQPYLVAAEAAGQGNVFLYPLAGGASESLMTTPAQIVAPFSDFSAVDASEIYYTGGINVAMGDVNSDGEPDAVVSQQVGGRVVVLDGATKFYKKPLFELAPFGLNPGFAVNVATADVNGDTHADLVVAGGVGADSTVKVYSGATQKLLTEFKAVDDPTYRGGVSLASGNVDGSGRDRLLTAPAQGAAPEVSIWGWDLFTKIAATPAPSAAALSEAGLLGAPELKARLLAGDPLDRRGLSLATSYYGAAYGGFRRILTAPSTDTDRATLWRVIDQGASGGHGSHAGHGSQGADYALEQVTQFRPQQGITRAQGFSLGSVSTPTGSVVVLAPRDGGRTVSTFRPFDSGALLPEAEGIVPQETLFRLGTSAPVNLAGS
jgi:FtsP/CotA-like multicopper oxidase with cupredoxin domain